MRSDSSPDPTPARGEFKRRGHIVLTLLATLVLVGLVPLVTMSRILIRENHESLSRELLRNQLMITSSIAREVDLHVEALRGQLESVGKMLGAKDRRRGSLAREEIRRALVQIAGERMTYVRYTYFENDVFRSVSAGDHPEHLEPFFQATLQQAAGVLARRTDSDAEVPAILSDPIRFEEGTAGTVVVVAAPVVSAGSFRGVLTALIDLDRVWDEVIAPKKTEGHFVFALDATGGVFATSDPERLRPGRQVDSELVRAFLSGRERAQAMPFTQTRGEEERDFIGAFSKTDMGWGVFVQESSENVYWSVEELKRTTLLWMSALILMAGLAAVFFARTLSDPINRLAAASHALAAGEFSARVHVRSRNEIGELAYTFNKMAEQIECDIRENKALFDGTIRALAEAIDAKDRYTRGHSVRVNRYSVIIARQMGLDKDEIDRIYVASLLHDVGKIGIDDSILKTDRQLTDEEFAIIKTHPVLGANIMAPIRQMQPMLPGLRYHHERCNGRGYPDGLTRDEIPLMARIIAVADTFDAITTVRPYQNPMTYEQAIARVNELRGPALDCDVVDAFNRACALGEIRLDDEQSDDVPTSADVTDHVPVPVGVD